MSRAPFHLMLDLDGVVLQGWHHDPKYRKDWSEHIERDIGFPKEFVPKIFAHSNYPKVAAGFLDLKDHLGHIFSDIGIAQDVDVFVDYWHTRDTSLAYLNHDLLTYVTTLREKYGARTALVTQQEKYRAAAIKKHLNLQDYFEGLFFTCDVGLLKNDPAFYRHVADISKISPEDILYFDDSPDYITAARAAGWPTTQYITITEFEHHPNISPLISVVKPSIVLA